MRSIGRTNSKESSFSDDDDDVVKVMVLQERRRKKNKVMKCWVGIVVCGGVRKICCDSNCGEGKVVVERKE